MTIEKTQVQRVEKHIIRKSNKNLQQIDHLCFLSKNLKKSNRG